MSMDVLGHEVGMRPKSAACTFDLNDDGMMPETVEQCGRDDRVTKHLVPFREAPVRGQDHRTFIPTDMAEKMKALERENRELRKANEIRRLS